MLANKLQIQKDPLLVYTFLDYICNYMRYYDPHLVPEVMKLDLNGYFNYVEGKSGGSIIFKTDYFNKLNDPIQRIKYVVDNFRFNIVDFDPDRFDECCICTNKPLDAVIDKCGHFICSKCFFTILDRNLLKVVCPMCRCSETSGVHEINYSFYPISLKKEFAEIYRHGNTVITIETNGNATIYA